MPSHLITYLALTELQPGLTQEATKPQKQSQVHKLKQIKQV